jgi:signal transduction histidine kinase
LTARSLRFRLLMAAMAAIATALGVAWLGMTLIFERHIEYRVAEELQRTGLQLTAALTMAANGAPALDSQPSDPRFAAPAGGLYWQVSTPSGAVRSRSLWDQALAPPPEKDRDGWDTRVARGAFGQRLLLVERAVRPDRAGPEVLVQLAYDTRQLGQARGEFGRELALFLVLLWGVLTAAAWAQVRLGLKPLDRIRTELAALERNPSERLAGDHPREIQPLIGAINALADAREKDLARARRRAADLAHGLKTPLAALAAQSRRARNAGAGEAADGLEQAIAAVSAAVESELIRTRLTTVRHGLGHPRDVIERLICVIERTEQGQLLAIEIETPDDMTVPADDDDLAELFGALLENAARHARRRVRVSGASTPRHISVSVEDDGPGIRADEAKAALTRGGRLDEAGPGHGLGLSIARDIAEATGGSLALEESELGGLCAVIRWKVDR